MTTPPSRSLQAVFTVTVKSRGGPAFFDRDGFVLHAASRIEGALEGSDDIRDVTVVEARPATVPASAPNDQAATCSCGHAPDPGICPVEHNGYKAGGHCVCAHDGKPLPATTGVNLNNLLVDTLTSYFANFSDEESARINAADAARAVLQQLLGPVPADMDVPSWTAIRAIQLMNEAGEQTEAYRLALSQVLGLGTGANWEALRDRGRDLVAEVAELTGAVRRLGDREQAPTDRAAILQQEADRIRAHCPDHLDSDSQPGSWMVCHCDVADEMLRRLADAASGPGRADGEPQQDGKQAAGGVR